ncbi:MAG: alpha/beta hydrolase, partial [Gammaproteobacteria bacterium]|nr:alpha/beta hydrolase [Gammaproteobacteria bacterium]
MSRPARLAAALLGALAAGRAPGAPLALSECVLEHPLKLTALSAQCGTLAVPEDYAQPAGRRIALRIARLPAISRRQNAAPLFVLAGGPGQGAADFYVSVAPAFARIRRERDIVLVDQRGTG